MRIKRGVKLRGLSPQMALAAAVVNDVYNEMGVKPTITSGSDGTHRRGSLHYVGDALDFRIRNLSDLQRVHVAQLISDSLGDEYDCVLEGDHLHVEYQPKAE